MSNTKHRHGQSVDAGDLSHSLERTSRGPSTLTRNSIGKLLDKADKGLGLNLHGGRKPVYFAICVSSLQAHLGDRGESALQLAWVRGDVTLVTTASIPTAGNARRVQWSGTLEQVVTLTMTGNAFKAKDCKFKVQVPASGTSGKHAQPRTVAKSSMLDISAYCSEIGLAREQVVEIPLTPCGKLEMLVCSYPTTAEAAEGAALNKLQGAAQGASRPTALKPSASMSAHSPLTWTDSGVHSAALAGLNAGPDHSTPASVQPAPSSPRPKANSLQLAATVGAAAAIGTAAAATVPGHRRARSQGLGGLLAAFTGGSTDTAASAPTSAAPSAPASSAPTPRGKEGGTASSVLDRVRMFDRRVSGPTPPSGSPPQANKPPLPGSAGTRSPASRGPASGQPSPTSKASILLDDDDDDDMRKLTKRAAAPPGQRARVQSTPLAEISSDDESSNEAEFPRSSAPQPSFATVVPHSLPQTSSHPVMHRSSRLSGASTPQHISSSATASQPLQQMHWQQQQQAASTARSSASKDMARAAAAASAGVPIGAVMLADGPQRCTSLPLSLSSRGLGISDSGPAQSPSSDTGMSSKDMTEAAARQGFVSTGGTAAGVASAGAAGCASLGAGHQTGHAWGGWLFGGWKKRAGTHSTAGCHGLDWDSTQLAAAVRETTGVTELRELALDLLSQRDEWRNRAVTSQEAAAHSKEAADAACSHAAQLAAELAAGRRDDAAMLEELVCAKLNMALLQEENLKLRKALLEAESTVDVAKEALAIAAEAAAAAVDEAAGVAEASHGHQPYRQLFMSHSTDLDVHA